MAATGGEPKPCIGAALFEVQSKANHACLEAANAHVVGAGVSGAAVVLVASRDVEKGDEIMFDYMHDVCEPGQMERRRKLLRDRYGFDCACSICVAYVKTIVT